MEKKEYALSRLENIQNHCLEFTKLIESIRYGDNEANDKMLDKLTEIIVDIGVNAAVAMISLI